MILAGDTGGTKTVLALFDRDGRIAREQLFHCAEFPSLEAILDAFNPGPLEGACFGVAGPVVAGSAKITNLPWTIEERALQQKLGAPVKLLNDLQATALGTLALPPEGFSVLQPEAHHDLHGTIAVIAPGTGLGEATLVHDGHRYVALPSEGGHADWAPGTDEELDLWRFLREKYGGHVSVERVLCGNGIGDLYDFYRRGAPHLPYQGDRNAAVTQAALDKTEPHAIRALDLFAELLGAEAGNVALRTMATGGVVIGGGIPPRILPVLQNGRLVARFSQKGRFHTWAQALGVRVALEPRAALLGAAHYVITSKD
ncbi:MAG: glucokinase [Deltaproteobacteria bacterium]|nr:glucokinase [Deltaproteobacteria bacterium]